jgi:DHA1 family tetracycline resistance protein-like MFS transporter
MASKKDAAISFIFITILLDVIGFGIIIPVIPNLIVELTGEGINEAARYGGWILFAFSVMQFFCAPIVGGLSDRYGRRPVLLLALLGLSIDCFLQAWAPTIIWLFIGRALAGMMGASYTTATAYIADISEPEKRAQNFGMIGAAFGLGFIIGPTIGGIFATWGIRVPFIISGCLAFLNFLYGYFILPESLKPENRRNFEWSRANPLATLSNLRKYPVVLGLSGSLLCIYLASHSVQSTWTFYTIFKFQWTPQIVGYSLGVVGILIALVQAGLIRIVIPKFGQVNSVYLGMGLTVIGLVLFSFASESWMMFAFLIPYCLGGIAGPAIQGIISSEVLPSEQGELQGALTSLMSITSIIGPPLMTNLFTFFSREEAPITFSGAAFMTGALLTIASLILAYRTLTYKVRHLKGTI